MSLRVLQVHFRNIKHELAGFCSISGDSWSVSGFSEGLVIFQEVSECFMVILRDLKQFQKRFKEFQKDSEVFYWHYMGYHGVYRSFGRSHGV